MKFKLSILLALLFASSSVLRADPPGRVARLNFVSGSVSFRPASLEDWAPATVNYPMSTGDHLWVDAGGKAELHVGSTIFRLGQQTAIEFLNLDDRTVQIKLSEGSLAVHARKVPDNSIMEIDTPSSAVSIDRPGVYRVNVTQEGRATVTVRHGELELTAAGQAVPVRATEEAQVNSADPPSYDIESAGPEDSFDDWALERDRHEENIASTRYVSEEVVGYEDLDTYGHWREVPDYGAVWAPASVEVGWSPYHAGHWGWVAPWGWTWVDDAPWGFAPFHYGRWAYVDGGWGWCPGTIVAEPVYAPALVAFVGGGGWSASLSFGGGFGVGAAAVGWFPLGPREVYVPPYPVSAVYAQQVNITNVRNITVNNFTVNNGVVTNVNVQRTTYVNQGVPGAVTAMPQAAFASARPVASVGVAVPATAIAAASISHTPPSGLQAQPVSVLGRAPNTLQSVPQPPAAIVNRSIVAKVAPPPAPPKFSPVLSPVVSNVTPKAASLVSNDPRFRAAVPAGGGKGLVPLRANIAQPRVVAASETHANLSKFGPTSNPGVTTGTNRPPNTGNTGATNTKGPVNSGTNRPPLTGNTPQNSGTNRPPNTGNTPQNTGTNRPPNTGNTKPLSTTGNPPVENGKPLEHRRTTGDNNTNTSHPTDNRGNNRPPSQPTPNPPSHNQSENKPAPHATPETHHNNPTPPPEHHNPPAQEHHNPPPPPAPEHHNPPPPPKPTPKPSPK
jgi:hypothetical protein